MLKVLVFVIGILLIMSNGMFFPIPNFLGLGLIGYLVFVLDKNS